MQNYLSDIMSPWYAQCRAGLITSPRLLEFRYQTTQSDIQSAGNALSHNMHTELSIKYNKVKNKKTVCFQFLTSPYLKPSAPWKFCHEMENTFFFFLPNEYMYVVPSCCQ